MEHDGVTGNDREHRGSGRMHCVAAGAGRTLLSMARPASTDPVAPAFWTAERYLALVDEGVLGPDDRVELLEGVIVSMAPQNVPHAAGGVRVRPGLPRAL